MDAGPLSAIAEHSAAPYSGPAPSGSPADAVGRAAVDECGVFSLDDLCVSFPTANGGVDVLHGVTFAIGRREILGLVGESGSGKSITARAAVGLLGSAAEIRGSMEFNGQEMVGHGDQALRHVRGRGIGLILQDPVAALNPVRTVGFHFREALALAGVRSRKEATEAAVSLLLRTGLSDPEAKLSAYPHQLSGGQSQRVTIALALALGPKLLIADEPTTALDVTVQAQILALVKRLRDETGMAILLITHDLGVVAETCDSVAVMYAGRIVERGPAAAVLNGPRHPYTRALIAASPTLDGPGGVLAAIPGAPPSPSEPPPGCPFSPRCERAKADCAGNEPVLSFAEGHSAACFHPLRPPEPS